MSQKPSIPKGTRDFTPDVMIKRNYIFDTIKEVYQLYGFLPIETPAMENLNTLMGKYGEEGDKLLFKTLNSGDYLSKVPDEEINKDNSLKLATQICEKGLRYDLTVPFARYVVQNRNDIIFPFKRYQIQPVWRADRPQKGRYREFYQCDADIIGSNSLVNEVELLQIIDEVYQRLNINVVIKLNNRKILSGIAELIGEKDRIIDITVAIDKLDKIGIDKVNQELEAKGVSKKAIEILQPIINMQGSASKKLALLDNNLQNIEVGIKGVEEIRFIMEQADKLGLKNELELDLTLARGLNYYTGAIIEVKAKDVSIGSICGGGRYDDLTGVFGLPDVSGVGISFGADRIFDVLEQLDEFPTDALGTSKLIFVCFGEKELSYVLPLLKKVRDAGIKAEVYPDIVKLKKQMNYANNKKIAFVALVGEEEMSTGKITLKDMASGHQDKLSIDEVINKIKN